MSEPTWATASALAQRGLRLFRLRRGSKSVFVDTDWTTQATANVNEVVKRFDDDKGDYNIGVLANGHVILDVDCKGAHDGFTALRALGTLPPTFRVRTPSGGEHIYFDARGEAFGQRDLAPGINVRATNGFVVGPGSTFEGKAYEIIDDAPIAPLPREIAERLRSAATHHPSAGRSIGELDTDAAINAAIDYLATAPAAVEGAGGDRTTYEVACRVLDFGISPETAVDLLDEHWNEHCSPPWDLDDLQRKVDNASSYRRSAVGIENPAFGYRAVPPELHAVPSPSGSGLLVFARDVSCEAILRRNSDAIVKGLFGPGDLGMLYGESTTGKTFAALDLAFTTAHGQPTWAGRRVKQAAVLYVSLEGIAGFDKRIEVAKQHHGDPGDYFARLAVPVTLTRSGGVEGVRLIVEAYMALLAVSGATRGLIVIDTLSRAIAGDDENDAKDMMHFYEQRAGSVVRQTGAAMLVVHHTNAEGRARGSSASKPTLDFMIRATRAGDDRELYAEKIKDGVEGTLLTYRLRVVELGEDDDGERVTSCVVIPESAEASTRRTRCEAAAKALMEKAFAQGKNLSPSPNTPGEGYAPRWLEKNQGPDDCFTATELERALRDGMGLNWRIEKYDNKKKNGAERYAPLSAATSPPHPSAATSAGLPPHPPEGGGAQ